MRLVVSISVDNGKGRLALWENLCGFEEHVRTSANVMRDNDESILTSFDVLITYQPLSLQILEGTGLKT